MLSFFFFFIIDLRFLTLKRAFGANIDRKDKGCLRVSLEAKSRITFLESFSQCKSVLVRCVFKRGSNSLFFLLASFWL